MLNFTLNTQTCISCGLCVKDCPASIITMDGNYPTIRPENEASCYKCQHCLALCPAGSISILGFKPEDSQSLSGQFPHPDQLELLIKSRRSIRQFLPENLDPKLIDRLLQTAWYAPTGVNSRQVLFTVVDNRDTLARIRQETMTALGRLVRGQSLPENMSFFAEFVRLWEEQQVDVLFRNAPHLLITSASPQSVSPMQDCMIAMTTFDLFAQTLGVGTVWDGLARWAIADLVPEIRQTLNIPPDHTFGYALAFGKPAIRFARTTQRGPAAINRVV